MAIADQLADHLTGLRFEDLPAETVGDVAEELLAATKESYDRDPK